MSLWGFLLRAGEGHELLVKLSAGFQPRVRGPQAVRLLLESVLTPLVAYMAETVVLE